MIGWRLKVSTQEESFGKNSKKQPNKMEQEQNLIDHFHLIVSRVSS